MPWRERSAMDEKASFILEWESGEHAFKALCKSYGVSRTLGYRLVLRYLLQGVAGLREQSRAPRRVWNRTADNVETAIVELRAQVETHRPPEDPPVAQRELPRTTKTAGYIDDRLGAQTPRDDQEAPPCLSHSGGAPDLRGQGPQRDLERGLQGQVPHARRALLLPADGDGRLQPIRAGRGGDAAAHL